MAYSTVQRGDLNSLDYRLYLAAPNGDPVSAFHDIPLYNSEDKVLLNMVVEIPRWTNAKMEICKEEALNPIKQDTKKGKLRFVKNLFPHHGYIWNYGAFPQTWEDPAHIDSHTKAKGDNDPLDVCEIGQKVHPRGSVVKVKVLGIMALIDEGETDWKVIVIDDSDPLAEKMSDISDVEKYMPGFLQVTFEWFRDYKVPDGKPWNNFAFDGKAKDKAFADSIIQQTHEQWKRLMDGGDSSISRENTGLTDSAFMISADSAREVISKHNEPRVDQPLPYDVDKWHYV